MVTFSSNNILQKNPPGGPSKRDKRKAKKAAKKVAKAGQNPNQQGAMIANVGVATKSTKPSKVKPSKSKQPKPPKAKYKKPTGGNWKDLSRKDKIKHAVRGNGRNSGLWDDITSKKVDPKVLTNDQITNSTTLNIDENPSILSLIHI